MIGKENNLLIVGLGNPGSKYEKTYHNMGFMVVDRLIEKLGVLNKKDECSSEVYLKYSSNGNIVLAKPQTYMNLSGQAVRELIGKYIADVSQLIVIFDDVDIPLGKIRVRRNGSAGTHNGMRNIVELIKTKEFPRVRIGIGSDDDTDLIKKVLSKVDGEKSEAINHALTYATEGLINFIENRDLDKLIRWGSEC